ncbi:SDR family NAD(P)-dependent oxidoreductase [Aurantivibrio plasticivorans]
MDLELKGARFLVSGGTRGIGKAIVTALLQEGCRVSTCGRSSDSLDSLASELSAHHGDSLKTYQVDISNHSSVEQWVNESASLWGGIDGIVVNASAMMTGSDLEGWKQMLDSDLLGNIQFVTSAIPQLAHSDHASITFINSTASIESAVDVMGGNSVAPYGSVKASLLHYASMLSTQLAPEGIRVNSVSPGPVEFSGGVWDNIRQHNPPVYNAMKERCRIGRMGRPSDVSNAVLFLASPAASFITGSNLVVDGGATRRVQF